MADMVFLTEKPDPRSVRKLDLLEALVRGHPLPSTVLESGAIVAVVPCATPSSLKSVDLSRRARTCH
jgi:hypothetical protein